MTEESPLAHTPFFFVGPRPYREAELAAYIHREHRRGRALADILEDARVVNCGSEALVRAVLLRSGLIRELGRSIAKSIVRDRTPGVQNA